MDEQVKKYVIELPEDTPDQLTKNLEELTEEYVKLHFEGIDVPAFKKGMDIGYGRAWEILKQPRSTDEWVKLYQYMGIKDFTELGSKYTPREGIEKIREFDKNKHWSTTCPICEYDISCCQCLFGGTAHPDRSMREQAVKDHLQYLSEEQVKHIIYLERNWNTSGIGEYQDVVDELKEKAKFIKTEDDNEQSD